MAKINLFKKNDPNEYLGLKVNKAYLFDEKWKLISDEELFDIKFGQIWNMEARIALHCELKGEKFFICTTQEDMDGLRAKHPNATVIHLLQLYKIWNGVVDENYVMNVLPKVLMTIKNIPSSRVVDHFKN